MQRSWMFPAKVRKLRTYRSCDKDDCDLYLQIRQGLEDVELHQFISPLDRGLMQLAAREVEAGGFCGRTRDNDQSIVLLGQAFEPRTGVNGVANCGDDLRARRSHRADNRRAVM